MNNKFFKKIAFLNGIRHYLSFKHESNREEIKQTQVDFVQADPLHYGNLVYSYSFNENNIIEYNAENKSSHLNINGMHMESNHLSTSTAWHLYEETNGIQSVSSIITLIKNNQAKLSNLRNHPVILYLTDIREVDSSLVNINNNDIKEFINLIKDIPDDIQEIDLILHSNGGYMSSAHRIIELLRSRFKKVNFLIPFTAYSAASMMCMAADEIIMTPESSLSPFDVQILVPDTYNEYLPARLMIECSKEAKKSLNPFCIFTPRDMYKNWNWKMIKNTKLLCDISIKESRVYPLYWLMKYMFKSHTPSNVYFTEVFFMPFWKRFTLNGRKANRIVNTFINLGIKLSHSTPIMCNDMKNMGLRVNCAEGELLQLMRETYQLSDKLFERSNLTKLFVNTDKDVYYHKPMV